MHDCEPHTSSRRLILMTVVCLAVFGVTSCRANDQTVSIWTTGSALMPGWGLYPNGTTYGGTEVLGGHAAWGTGQLTWVAQVPASGTYDVWVRHYGGYGSVEVAVNDQDVSGGKGGDGGGRYVWRHLGEIPISRGEIHLDVRINGTMFDAVLLTNNREFSPDADSLPDPVTEPILRAPR